MEAIPLRYAAAIAVGTVTVTPASGLSSLSRVLGLGGIWLSATQDSWSKKPRKAQGSYRWANGLQGRDPAQETLLGCGLWCPAGAAPRLRAAAQQCTHWLDRSWRL